MDHTDKRAREDFTNEESAILEEYWKDGMKSAGKSCTNLIKEVSSRLNIVPDRVCAWIGNRNSKERRKVSGNLSLPKKRSTINGPNAYSYFISTVKRGSMDGPSFMKFTSSKWKEMTEDEKKPFFVESAEIRADPCKGKSRAELVSAQLKIIQNAVDILGSLKYEVCGLGKDTTEECCSLVFGTPTSVKFVDTKMEIHYQSFLSGTTAPTPAGEKVKQSLRLKVRSLFKNAWAEATGSDKPVPYRKLLDGSSRYGVVGLPDTINFADPSCYGLASLQSILRLKGQVKFVPRNNNAEDSVPTNTNLVANAVVPSTSLSNVNVPSSSSSTVNVPSTSSSNVNVPSTSSSTVNVPSTSSSTDNVPSTSSSTRSIQRKQLKEKVNTKKIKKEATVPRKRKNTLEEETETRDLEYDITPEAADLLSDLLQIPPTQEVVNPTPDDLYEIEQIMGERKKNKKQEVLVRWKGCDQLDWIDKKEVVHINKAI